MSSKEDVGAAGLRIKAEQGDAEAQYSLGKIYGSWITDEAPPDEQEAFKWYQLSADQGHVLAQYRLGDMYAHGTAFVPQDNVQAYMWYELVASSDAGDALFEQWEQEQLIARGGRPLPPMSDEEMSWMFDAQMPSVLGHPQRWPHPDSEIGQQIGKLLDASEDAVCNRDRLAEEMPPEDIAEAKTLASEWKPKAPSVVPPDPRHTTASIWYYTDNGQKAGPVPFDFLKDKRRLGELGYDDSVWTEEWESWERVFEVPELWEIELSPANERAEILNRLRELKTLSPPPLPPQEP